MHSVHKEIQQVYRCRPTSEWHVTYDVNKLMTSTHHHTSHYACLATSQILAMTANECCALNSKWTGEIKKKLNNHWLVSEFWFHCSNAQLPVWVGIARFRCQLCWNVDSAMKLPKYIRPSNLCTRCQASSGIWSSSTLIESASEPANYRFWCWNHTSLTNILAFSSLILHRLYKCKINFFPCESESLKLANSVKIQKFGLSQIKLDLCKWPEFGWCRSQIPVHLFTGNRSYLDPPGKNSLFSLFTAILQTIF